MQIILHSDIIIPQTISHVLLLISLIRMFKAPLSEDGKRALNIKEVPSLNDQIARNIMKPRSSPYNAQLTHTVDFVFIQSNIVFITIQNVSLNQKMNYLLKELSDLIQVLEKLHIYQQNLISFTHDIFMIDMMYFSKYRLQAEFKLIVDGLYNVVNQSHMYVGAIEYDDVCFKFKENANRLDYIICILTCLFMQCLAVIDYQYRIQRIQEK